MEIAALVALTIAITQVIKSVLKMVSPNVIAVVVAIGVVAYKAVATGMPFTFPLLMVAVQVIVGAIGAFKVGQQLLSDKAQVK